MNLSRRVFSLGLAATALSPRLALASAVGRYRYSVQHSDHGELGWHEVLIEDRAEGRMVTFERKLEVGQIFTLFYEETKGVELWQDGRLKHFSGRTDRDGEVSEVAIQLDGDRYVIEATAGKAEAPASAFLAHAWNLEATHATTLIEASSGAVRAVSTKKIGRETLATPAGTFAANRFHTQGELTRDLWYADDGTWLKQETPRDDAVVSFVLVEMSR